MKSMFLDNYKDAEIIMTEPVIDEQAYKEIADLMDDSMGIFIETYLENSPKLIEGLCVALPEGDIDAVIHHSHQLKGGSGSIGARQVFVAANRMETNARDGILDGLTSELDELKSAYDLVETELRSRL